MAEDKHEPIVPEDEEQQEGTAISPEELEDIAGGRNKKNTFLRWGKTSSSYTTKEAAERLGGGGAIR